jgi:hypothetical protein
MPSTSFTHFSFILSRVGKREFCDHMFRCIIHSLHGGMSSRHALRYRFSARLPHARVPLRVLLTGRAYRAAEMSACLVALCGGKDLVATLFSQYLGLCHFGQKYPVPVRRVSCVDVLPYGAYVGDWKRAQDAVLWSAGSLHVGTVGSSHGHAPRTAQPARPGQATVRRRLPLSSPRCVKPRPRFPNAAVVGAVCVL